MTDDDVADYLRAHPDFYEHQPELLETAFIPHPHGGRTVSIAERQILLLREKARVLQTRLTDLLRFGEENDALGDKLHRLTVALIAASDADALLGTVREHLQGPFEVPHTALRVWGLAGEGEAFVPAGADLGEGVAELAAPRCGPVAPPALLGWFGDAAGLLRSFALVPLKAPGTATRPVGLLVLASEDPKRFYPDMGTVYLARMGELIGAGFARHAG